MKTPSQTIRGAPAPHRRLWWRIARCLAEDAPLLLVIDEFGKNLEAIRDGGDADPYLLQQLAEAGQGSGLPIFLLTLQHLSFEEHLSGADAAQRREWAKVQGRFEDIAFVSQPARPALSSAPCSVCTTNRCRLGSTGGPAVRPRPCGHWGSLISPTRECWRPAIRSIPWPRWCFPSCAAATASMSGRYSRS